MKVNDRCGVLIVEDDESIAQFVQAVLAEEGYRVEVALSGEEGLAKVKSFHPDVVLLDLLLPGMDGATFMRELRRLTEGVRVILMTAAREGGEGIPPSEGLLLKPFDLNMLLGEVERVVAGMPCR